MKTLKSILFCLTFSLATSFTFAQSNEAHIKQVSELNEPVTTQNGSKNEVVVEQTGKNEALIEQDGFQNYAFMLQSGSNSGIITQEGNHRADVQQMGNSTALVFQNGENNSGVVKQEGVDNQATITQYGSDLEAIVHQFGDENLATILQDFREYDSSSEFIYRKAEIIQHNNGNIAIVDQRVPTEDAIQVTQYGGMEVRIEHH